jgi:D-cysteine desulfhydrase
MSIRSIPALARMPRAGLGVSPTPFEHLTRVSAKVARDVWIKRDDVLPLGMGGNKVRKLDLILGQALRDGVDTILTTGGIQSNHCRLTAAAAARLGMQCVIFLRADPPADSRGNVLLDRLFGAEIQYTGQVAYADVDERMAETADALRRTGRTPLVVPLGGATAVGTAAYVEAVAELAAQAAEQHLEPRTIVVAAGSGSTMAGIWIGARSWLPETEVLGVSVSWPVERLREIADALGAETAGLLGAPMPDPDRLRITSAYVGGGYTVPTPGGRDALSMVGAQEGVLLDLTYTAKAFEALIAELTAGRIAGPVVFWHTGGAPELFARPESEVLGGVPDR